MDFTLPTLMIGLIGFVCGGALAVAARLFGVKEDPLVQQAIEILPGVNCGACGYAGCAEYAHAVALKGEKVSLCSPGGHEAAQKLGALMGRSAEHAVRKVALVLCKGDSTQSPRRADYNGIADCTAAHAVNGGDKACRYGCLGYGSCARVCPTDAIEITPAHLAVVHPDLCIGCGACVKACPRTLIRMIPETGLIHVLCSNPDKGPDVKKVCKVGCIGCTACAKFAGNEAIRMEGRLAVVDYTKPAADPIVIEKCPTKTIERRPMRHTSPAPLTPKPAEPAPAEVAS